MKTYLVTSISALVVGSLGMFGATANAQDDEPRTVELAHFGRVAVYPSKGYFEYAADGVPVVGLITGEAKDGQVKFTMCDSKTIDVDFRHLSQSLRGCPASPRGGFPWTVMFRASGSGGLVSVKLDGELMKLDDLPEPYRGKIQSARVGEAVGFAFIDEEGRRSLAILDAPTSDGPER